MSDATKAMDEIGIEKVEADNFEPFVDGLEKVAKYTVDTKRAVDGKITNLETKMKNEISGITEKIEKGIGDVIDRVETLSKRASVFGRLNFDQDDMSALKSALPERTQNRVSAYERETLKGAGLFADPRGLAATHQWFALSTKLQMRQFDADRDRNIAEFRKLNDTLEVMEKAALNETTAADGGYSVPTIIGNEVLKIIRDASIIYSRARQIPMTSNVLDFPDEASAVGVGWAAEGVTLTGSEPSFGHKTLTAKKLVGRATFSLELIDDSNVAIIPFLQSCFAEKMGGELDFQAMEGTGTVFTGVLNATSVGDVARTNGTNGVTLSYNRPGTWGSLIALYVKGGEQSSIKGGTWVCGPGVYGQVVGMVDSNGQPVVRLGTVEGQPNETIMGRPILVSNRLGLTTISTGTNSVGSLYYGPMNALLFGTRQGMRWDVTDQVSWSTYRADARLVGRFAFVAGVPTAWAKQSGINVT